MPNIFDSSENGPVNGTLDDDAVRGNSVIEHNFEGFSNMQMLDLTWDLPGGMGYVALENGNGRTTIFTSPTVKDLKVNHFTSKYQHGLGLYNIYLLRLLLEQIVRVPQSKWSLVIRQVT